MAHPIRPCGSDMAPPAGPVLSEGTIIFTMEGALPVEFLNAGDRLITRTGARALSRVEPRAAGFVLGFEQPETIYADGAEVLVG